MVFQVKIQSKEQIFGDLVRTLLINTDLTDVAANSTLGTLLEGIATSHFQISVSALKILESSNLESLTGTDLDKKAISMKIPNGVGGIGRKPSSQAISVVRIGSAFKKISSKQYAGKPAPFAGSMRLFLENAEAFPAVGSVYIARGTVDRFEGPIPYTSVINTGSYWEMTLASPLTKPHLSSDLVVLAQGGDRTVPAGTVVQTKSNNETPSVQFVTTEELVIPDGEAEGMVQVACTQFGEIGNALAGSIVEFASVPFSGATVTNPTSFINGRSTENDEDLRIRIKNYPATLSRGTATAILAAILGAVDPVSGRSIQSGTVLEPVEPGDSARVYVDDGTGLEPSFDGQPYELLLQNASGQESRFRAAQFPITPATAVGSNFGPFAITDTMTLTVRIDEITETYSITANNYKNLNAVTAYELARDFNSQSNIVGFRTLDEGTRLVLIDLSGEAELLQIESGELQTILGIPTSDIRPIYLYENSVIQSFRGKTATLETRPRNLWSLSPTDLQNVRVKVDGVIQTITIQDSDFAEFSTTINSATVSQWATVFARKIAGVKFTVSGQRIIWSTYQTFSETGTLEIMEERADGTAAPWIGSSKIWTPATDGGKLLDVGYQKDFRFNRFTGEINFTTKPPAGSVIEIGSRSTRAFIKSAETSTGLFATAQLPATVGNARIVVGFDGDFLIREVNIPIASSFTPTIPDPSGASNIIRLTANAPDIFQNAEVADYLYLIQDQSIVPTWGSEVEGIYRIKAKGNNLYAINQNYSTLSISVGGIATPAIQVFKDTPTVRVTHTDHGLRTGDIINVSTTTAVGGISGANLSVTGASIIVVDKNRYLYTALANATSDATGIIDAYIGYNRVTVTHTAHGFESGATIDTTAAAPVGGISAGDLSVSGAVIEVVDANTYRYRADAAATTAGPSTGTLTTVTYIADTWIEIEVSATQLADWTPLLTVAQFLTVNMVNIFKSTVIPQIVDFGASATLTADEVVSIINENISSGTCEKVSPRQVVLRSNNYVGGTVAVLAVIGSANSIFEEPTISTSIQAHTANAPSGYTGTGFPVIESIELPTAPASGHATRTYVKVDRDLVHINDQADNPAIESPSSYVTSYPVGFEVLWISGRQYGLTARVYNNQTTAPFSGILRGEDTIRPLQTSDSEQTSPDTLDRYANYDLRMQDLPFNNYDKFVAEMDLDPIDKTVAVNLFKLAKIQDIDAITGAGKGQVISFRLKDPEDGDKPFFNSDSVYKNFNFEDFKILTRAVGLYREDVSDRVLIIRSYFFGSPARFHFSIQLPEEPDIADVKISHINDFSNNYARTTVIAVLPSDVLIPGSTLISGNYNVAVTTSGNLYDFRITSGTLNSGNEYQPGNVLNISGGSPINGSYQIDSADFKNFVGASASTTIASSTVTVTVVGHGLITGDLISVSTGAAIGGISAANLSQSDTPVNVTGPNTFTYEAGGVATASSIGVLSSITGGRVTVKSPGNGGITSSFTYSAAQYPIRSWEFLDTTFNQVRDALNAYLPDNPIIIAETIGTNLATTFIQEPTYISNTAASAYTGADMNKALLHHAFKTKFSGSAGIWQYDSSNPALNNIKATVQTDDSIYPTITEGAGTAYTPINEEVMIVPTNTSTLRRWLDFNAASSLNLLTRIEKINSDTKFQLSSREDGENGAIKVTGVSANSVETGVIGNGSEDEDGLRVRVLSADAKPILRDSIVKVQNLIRSEIGRPYRVIPTGSSITSANTININNFFRPTNAIKYIRVNANKARIAFYRNGMGPLQTEPLTGVTSITLTNLGSGLVQVTCTGGSSELSARVGDMMYVRPDSAFPVDVRCKGLPSGGVTDPNSPEYLGYPVVHVIDDTNIIILAPNITSFGATVPNTVTDLVFMPGIWNEKNIRTNHKEGAKFDDLVNNGEMYALVKTLGNGFISLWVQNSSAESTDTMRLQDLSVSTDDFIQIGSGFDPANQGTFKIVAHNGRNHIIYYNPNGGIDEVLDTDTFLNGGTGERKWRVGPMNDGVNRPIRILDAESIRIGDYLRISSPSVSGQWFPSTMFGSWKISGIGYQALDYTGYPLPHDTSDGSFDYSKICPFIEIELPNAPISIKDSSNNDVDNFLIGNNDTSIGFVEGTAFFGFRIVAGHGISPTNSEESELYLRPKRFTSKMTDTFGTVISSPYKINFQDLTYTGIDGYKIFSGLIQQAHRIIDGLPTNIALFPGVKAAGTVIEVLPPLIRAIQLELQVRPKDGVTLNSITDLVKATVERYINTLGVGRPVVLSEIIRVVQGLPGVFSVTILSTRPVANDDRIVVSEIEKPYIIDITRDISVG
ncbi:MAG: baseplate J/gp47 family protein [Thermoplasmatales archaeon]